MTRPEAAAAIVLACSAAIEKAHQQHSTPLNAKSPNPICIFHVHVIAQLQYIVLVDSASRGLNQLIQWFVINTSRSVCP